MTHQFPKGRIVQVKVLPLLGNVVGIHKVAGFASHTAKRYCAWCWGVSSDTNKMVVDRIQTKEEVIEASRQSKDACSYAKKDLILAETGVHWSEFNHLSY
ncbi:hypothetical protein CROQUDRAFT_49367 [Cronartium quercuum f. sp. fusiforme G11]|uniref:Uncharacterized protein n=1 Tax=Cronartium quercuum f. sp. fusiforme G11 TaxID=708437 RepID=A0A9P6NF42_9BASI|nr:hypothetical protein CROQUDRAFT_49367 [Cronartium quercuum f. sp. fusiforme G11]